LDAETALKGAGAFGGGIGHLGRTCGAVTDSFMVIGLKYGKTKAEDGEMKEKTYRLAGEFVEEFRARNESTLFRDLLGSDIGTPEGMQLAEERGLFTSLCTKLVQDLAEIPGQLLERE
jgi:C_GCAxxG_C_C family probable redox protein